MTVKTFKNWRCEIDDHQIFWLIIDRAGKSMNTLDSTTIKELDAVIDLIEEQQNDIIGVAVKSGKERGFIAGADVEEFTKVETEEDAENLIKSAQSSLNRLEALRVPSIALIDGPTLGGGLEFSLACTYRVAIDAPEVKIGLPEVLLGILPGWGGTVRLPRLIGAFKALPMIIAGRTVNAYKAKKLGIIDDVVRNKHLLQNAAVYFLTNKPRPRKANFVERLSNHSLLRKVIAARARKQTEQKIKQAHYPAPFHIIDNWNANGVELKPGLRAEAKSIAQCIVHPTARQLVRMFFLRTRMSGLGKSKDFIPQSVHVIGAGTMGGDIAAYCALKGMRVTLQDREMEFIAPAIKRAHQLFKKKCTNDYDVTAAMDRLIPDPQGAGVAKADVIIEAIYENLEAKQALYKDIEPRMKKGALLATNTSSIPLEDLCKVLKNKGRLIGVHFFNPVSKMMLVEVVRGQNSDESEVEKGLAFVGRISKLPIPVTSSPGFLINRILMPYMMEAVMLLDEGVAPASIDKAAVDFGMPMGPLELADMVGLDVGLSVAETLTKYFGGKVPKKLRELVDHGNLGKKTGKGVYQWRDGKPVKVSLYQQGDVPDDITDRMILVMVNEAIACWDEGVIDDADLLDGGMVFATGWAPFRGGPVKYAELEGYQKIYERLEALAKKHGERFKPHTGWQKLLKETKKKGKTDAKV